MKQNLVFAFVLGCLTSVAYSQPNPCDDCMNLCMATGYGLVMDNMYPCEECECTHVCAYMWCDDHKECQPMDVNCFRAPCPPVGDCVDKKDEFNCTDRCNGGYCSGEPVKCDEGCNTTRYGKNCENNCSRSCRDGECNPEDGSCLSCPDGKWGVFCDEFCPSGCPVETCSASSWGESSCYEMCEITENPWCGDSMCSNCTDFCQGQICVHPGPPVAAANNIATSVTLLWSAALVIKAVF